MPDPILNADPIEADIRRVLRAIADAEATVDDHIWYDHDRYAAAQELVTLGRELDAAQELVTLGHELDALVLDQIERDRWLAAQDEDDRRAENAA